jgi:molecular chaperone DnaK (HSP70)
VSLTTKYPIGIATYGGKFEIVFDAGTFVPTIHRLILSTGKDGQQATTIKILEGTSSPELLGLAAEQRPWAADAPRNSFRIKADATH